MSEDWRRKDYYRHRALIPVAETLADVHTVGWIGCLSGAELGIIRKLLQYAHWRSTWVSEAHQGYYLAPDNEEWDSLEALVAALEDKLMGCDALLDILESINGNLECLCRAANYARDTGDALPAIIPRYLEDGTFVEIDTNGDTVPVLEERCAIAQVTYWMGYSVVSSLISPLEDVTLDIGVPALVGLLFWIAGGPVLGIPAGLAVAVVRALLELQAGGTLLDVLDVYEAHQEDLICAVYKGLETGYGAAEDAAVAVIWDMEGITPVAKVALHCLFAPWAMMIAKNAIDNDSQFYQEHVEPGYCTVCDIIEGSDWLAHYIPIPLGDIELDHSEVGDYWVDAAACQPLLGYTTCGVVVTCLEKTGCTCELMQNISECTGDDLLSSQGYDMEEGHTVYIYDPFTHNDEEVVDELCPGADLWTEHQLRVGPGTWRVGAHLGWSCTGTAQLRVNYVVYLKPT